MDAHALTPLVVIALFIWVMYRRVRRNFGPQLVRPGSLMFRAGLFALLAVFGIAGFALKSPALLGAIVGGIIAGVVLGYFGLRHTRFEAAPQGRVYIPHTYIGLFVTSLLLIRVAMRFMTMSADPQQYAAAQQNPWAAYQNPLTLAIFGVVVGYYVFYNIGVLRKSREPTLPSTETPAS